MVVPEAGKRKVRWWFVAYGALAAAFGTFLLKDSLSQEMMSAYPRMASAVGMDTRFSWLFLLVRLLITLGMLVGGFWLGHGRRCGRYLVMACIGSSLPLLHGPKLGHDPNYGAKLSLLLLVPLVTYITYTLETRSYSQSNHGEVRP